MFFSKLIGASVSEPHTSDVNRDFSLSLCLVCLSRTSCRIYAHYSIFAYFEHVRALIEIFAYKILAMDISSAQLPLDTDERSQLPPSVTDAAREERLRRRRERERARRASRDQKKRRQGM